MFIFVFNTHLWQLSPVILTSKLDGFRIPSQNSRRDSRCRIRAFQGVVFCYTPRNKTDGRLRGKPSQVRALRLRPHDHEGDQGDQGGMPTRHSALYAMTDRQATGRLVRPFCGLRIGFNLALYPVEPKPSNSSGSPVNHKAHLNSSYMAM